MCLFYLVAKQVDITSNHIERLMPEYLLQLEYIGAILHAHFSECMAKSMRTTSYVINTSHASIFRNSTTDAIAIHLLVILRNNKPIDGRIEIGRASSRDRRG